MRVQKVEATPDPETVIIRAARNDYSNEYVGDYSHDELIGSSGSESAEEFIKRLMDRGHWGPLEHVHLSIGINGVSRTMMAQLTRHRHMSFDVQSMRYVDLTDGSGFDVHQDMFSPQSAKNLPDGKYGSIYQQSLLDSIEDYRTLLDEGMPKEDARMVLPLATKVNIIVSGNLRSWLHILDLRYAGEAQSEIRQFATQVLKIVKEWCPIVGEYYEEEFNPRKNKLAP